MKTLSPSSVNVRFARGRQADKGLPESSLALCCLTERYDYGAPN